MKNYAIILCFALGLYAGTTAAASKLLEVVEESTATNAATVSALLD